MIVALCGSTGFIGQALLKKMLSKGWVVRLINRASFSKTDQEFLDEYIEGSDVVINLSGAPVSRKWTAGYKEDILTSRVMPARKISSAITLAQVKPSVFISASAIGIYDSENTHTESSKAYAASFLARVCLAWEQEAQSVESYSRVVIFRMGLVLGPGGGALKKMHLPFSIGLGAKVGNGTQAVSFIHIDDLTDAIVFAIENPSICGVVNAVTPYPSANTEFSDKLAKVLGRVRWLTVPAFVMKMMYGEGAQIILEGQRALPEKLESAGFSFRYPTIGNSLEQIYG